MFNFLPALIRIFCPLYYNATICARASERACARVWVFVFMRCFFFSFSFLHFIFTYSFLFDILHSWSIQQNFAWFVSILILFLSHCCLSSFTECIVIITHFYRTKAKKNQFLGDYLLRVCSIIVSSLISSLSVFSISSWNRNFQIFYFIQTFIILIGMIKT